MQVRYLLLVMLAITVSGTSHADYDVTSLNKLFTDKNQRAQMDAARSGKTSGTSQQQTKDVSVSGYVTRSDGKSVVWVNGKNTLESSKVDEVKVHQSSIGKNKKVTINVDGKTLRLKPGESWSQGAGVSDNAGGVGN